MAMIAALCSFLLSYSAGLFAQYEDEDITNQGWIDYNIRYDFNNNFGVYSDMGFRIISPYVWTRYYFRPAVSYTLSPSSRSWKTPIITFHLGSGIFYTNNVDYPDYTELRLFQGVNVGWPNFRKLRLRHYIRLEERFHFIDNKSSFDLRLRYMIGGTLRWPRKSADHLSNLYFPFHAEFFWDLNQASLFSDLIRITPGLGYDINADFRIEFSVSYHRNRIKYEDSFETNDVVLRLRFFHDIL
jgi:hypothetical protein